MNHPLPLKRLDNQFDKQFMAMRYLLLGLMEHVPLYGEALKALESASGYVNAYKRTNQEQPYAVKLQRAFAQYEKLSRSSPTSGPMAMQAILSPNFAGYPPIDVNEDDIMEALVVADEPDDLTERPLFERASGHFDKLYTSMEFFLLGVMVNQPEYFVAYDALHYASEIHVGTRKDGKTPEFQHQLEIAHHIRTMLRYAIYPAETLAAIFLHDTPEDYNVEYEVIDARFGPLVAEATDLMNKYDRNGNPKPPEVYYPGLAYNAITSLAKPGDNGNNQGSMAGVFSFKKEYEYSLNIKRQSWEMLKVARRLFPEQEAAYENLKLLLRVQYNAVQAKLKALQFDPATGQVHPALQA